MVHKKRKLSKFEPDSKIQSPKTSIPRSMTCSSSSYSSSSGGHFQEKHEVFISFRSTDTRKTFTSHLYAALTRLDIKTYSVDSSILERGDDLSSILLRAIEDARLSIIVFSTNYADSRWCLDEVTKILECKRSKGHMMVPVFYDIDPSSIRKQIASPAKAFQKHEQSTTDKDKLQRWRDALTEASNH